MPKTKQAIVNNGLPLGIFLRAMVPGTIVDTTWNDHEGLLRIVITESYDLERPHNWKGVAGFKGLDAEGGTQRFDATQIVDVLSDNLSDLLTSDALKSTTLVHRKEL